MNSIELKSIACKGLNSFTLFKKPSIYAAISVTGGAGSAGKRQKQRTPADRDSGENPEWDDPIRIDLDGLLQDRDLVLHFGLYAVGGNLLGVGGDKLVGEVRVPIADLAPEGITGGVRHVSYQVRSPEGKANGVLSFSYSIGYPKDYYIAPPAVSSNSPIPPPPSTYYPPPPPSAPSYYSTPDLAGYRAAYPPVSGYYSTPDPASCSAAYPPVSGYYSAPDPASCSAAYPPVSGYYSTPDPAGCSAAYPPVGDGYYYPPPPQPQQQAGYYPPQEAYGYRPESRDRGQRGYGVGRLLPYGYGSGYR